MYGNLAPKEISAKSVDFIPSQATGVL